MCKQRKETEYTLVGAADPTDLQQKVNNWLRTGWVTAGGIQVVSLPSTVPEIKLFFYQAVVKSVPCPNDKQKDT